MNKSASSRRKLVGIVTGLLLAVSEHALAAEHLPPLHPTKDVTVSYVRGDGKHIIVRTAAGGFPMRIDFPDQAGNDPNNRRDGDQDRGESYFVVLSPGATDMPDRPGVLSNHFYVWNGSHEFRYAESWWDDWPGRLQFASKNRDDMIAGVPCNDWNLQGAGLMVHGQILPDRRDSVCISDEGVLLRYLFGEDTFEITPGIEYKGFSNYSNGYPVSMIAESVNFDPLPPDLFAVPKNYRETYWPVPPSPPPPVIND